MLQLLDKQAANLRHSPLGLAYVRPALWALKYGADEDIADKMAMKARMEGIGMLVGSVAGLRLLFWLTMPRRGRRATRSFQSKIRDAVKSTNHILRGA